MEQITTQILNARQWAFLDAFKNIDYFVKNFYFTGGTPLSYYYLKHRVSVDLDFFTDQKFVSEFVQSVVAQIATALSASLESMQIENTLIYYLVFADGFRMKVDFSSYPYKQIEPTNLFDGIRVDSKKDIAVNKVVAISQRTEVKDFVDLYFLLKEYSIYELHELSNRKFKRDYDLMLFASDLLKAKHFDYLPNMLVDLNLDDLKSFYIDLAKNLGLTFTAK